MKHPRLYSVAYTLVGATLLFLSSNAIADSKSPRHSAGYKSFVMKDAKECAKPGDKVMSEYEEYGAVGICYSYRMKRDGDIFSDITNSVFDIVTVGGFFGVAPIDGAVLWAPEKGTVRFEVKRGGQRYRLCRYWAHDIHNVPPPGKYTDHKFINRTEYSIDYYTKIRQRGTGRNARISGVAETLFVPESEYAKALSAGFCTA